MQRLFPSCYTIAKSAVIEPSPIKRNDVIAYPTDMLEPRPVFRVPPPSPNFLPQKNGETRVNPLATLQKDDPDILLETIPYTVILNETNSFPGYLDLCLFVIILCLMVYMIAIGVEIITPP